MAGAERIQDWLEQSNFDELSGMNRFVDLENVLIVSLVLILISRSTGSKKKRFTSDIGSFYRPRTHVKVALFLSICPRGWAMGSGGSWTGLPPSGRPGK